MTYWSCIVVEISKSSFMAHFKARTTDRSFILQPSSIHGIGVFTMHAIAKGAYLALFSELERTTIRGLTKSNRLFVKRYGIPLGKLKYLCPSEFRRMSVGWYLNHADTPNAGHRNYHYFALKNIPCHTEITIDYTTL
jgi:SET domain-containing protein